MQKASRRQYGNEGEDLARGYLENKGYRWICSNFSTRWGEIDLIMSHRQTLVFIEVKRRSGDEYGHPEEAVTFTKKQHLVRAAYVYMQSMPDENLMMRFDVVSIGPTGVRHYLNAFTAGRDFYY